MTPARPTPGEPRRPARKIVRFEDPSGRLEPPEPDLGHLEVELPGGGKLTLGDEHEVVMWNTTKRKYIEDFRLAKANDLVLLGAILSQILAMYRAQRDLSDPKKAGDAQVLIAKAATEIRAGEKALGVDKASRERGGQHTVADYITRLKKAGYEKGIHISERVREYERVCMDARWKIRLLRNGDAEDRAYHNISEKSIIDWLEQELAELERKDKQWAREKGAVWVGRL